MAPAMSSMRGLSALAFLALAQAQYDSTMLTLPWSYDCKLQSETGVVDLVKDHGYYACADLEFCQVSETQFAYRLPGKPCAPLKAPIIRVRAGKKYQLTLHNTAYNASEACNLHTHGPHLSGDGNSDDVSRHAFPGEALRYTWNIPANHPGATFWYHDHIHEKTFKHVHGGAIGMLLIDEDEQNDPYFNLSPDFARWMRNEVLLVAAKVDNNHFGNGNCNEVLPVVQGEWFRWRQVSVNPIASDSPVLTLAPSKEGNVCMAYFTAHDGVFTWKIPEDPWAGNGVVVNGNSWTLSGANRADFAVNCPFAGDYDIFWGGGKVATFQVRPGVKTSATPWKPGNKQWDTVNECNPVVAKTQGKCVKGLRPDYNRDLRTYTGPVNKMFIEPTSAGIKFDNGPVQLFNMMVPTKVVGFDEVQEWTIKGSSGHPFHLHVYHMQVVTPGGCGPGAHYGELYDVIFANRDCTVRFRTADHPGRVIFHCHLLIHEDAGTMGWLNVTATPASVPIDRFQIAPVDETNTYSAKYNTQGPSWQGYTSATCIPDTKCYPTQQCSVGAVGIMMGVDRCGGVCALGDPLFSTCAYVGRIGATCGAGNLCRDAYPTRFADPLRKQTNSFCPGAPIYALTAEDGSSENTSPAPSSSNNMVWLAALAAPAVLLLAVPAFVIWRRQKHVQHEQLTELEIASSSTFSHPVPTTISPFGGHSQGPESIH